MCTITYIPLQDNSYILTQNRDVGKKRVSGTPPDTHMVDEKEIIFPVDPQGGGTWNAISSTEHAFILNGADFDYYPNFNAIKSRGELCINLLTHHENYLEQIDLREFDHFTLILVNTENRKVPIREWRWNGRDLSVKEFPADRPHFWISHGLYTSTDYERKEKVFTRWYDEHIRKLLGGKKSEIADEIWKWHHQKEVAGGEGFVIDRSTGVMTVSIFQTIKRKLAFDFKYKDMKTSKIDTRKWHPTI